MKASHSSAVGEKHQPRRSAYYFCGRPKVKTAADSEQKDEGLFVSQHSSKGCLTFPLIGDGYLTTKITSASAVNVCGFPLNLKQTFKSESFLFLKLSRY